MTATESSNSHADDAFQQLLLQISAAAAEGSQPEALIRLFCQSTRQFFQVEGVCFWKRVSRDELLVTEADGALADQVRGLRLKADQSAIVLEAIRNRATVYVNHLDPARSVLATRFQAARSIMAAPLIVANEVIGAAVFWHFTVPEFFNDDLATKATILAGQLGTLLEANRLNQIAHEEHRRAEILAEVAHTLHGVPNESSVLEALADRLRILLRTRLVCIVISQGAGFTLRAAAAETAQLADLARARHDRKGLQFAGEIAARAIEAGEPITVAIDPSVHALEEVVPGGTLLAAPFRSSVVQGAVLVYPREEGGFSKEEKSLVAAVAGFGAVALSNAELYATAREQTRELHQLLDISAELNSIGHLDEFMQKFAVRAADFLGFNRACIGLLEEDGAFHLRWKAENGRAGRMEMKIAGDAISRALSQKEVFWTNDPNTVPSANLHGMFEAAQLLTVPLLSSDGQVLGMFAALDRTSMAGISQEDVRRAKALATQAAVALEITRDLELSERHRRRAESLIQLALELGSLLKVSDFAQSVVKHAAALMEAISATLLVKHESSWETAASLETGDTVSGADSLARRLAHIVPEILSRHPQTIISSTAGDLLGPALASSFGWNDCTLVRLLGASGDLMGVLCLANRGRALSQDDQQLLHAIASHAAIGLGNARLFTRMERANRHWIEIFDAISDFIVVHDEADKVLRVNRSLADFMGASPPALIGVNMGALLAQDEPAFLVGCPFCRMAGETPDEFVHPALERVYLISTSRVHGDSSEGLQTIHVLKDITDRREAERRYKELFSNIQEGLFFATPEGRFIEVNDALVRMLGYGSREELLQADIRDQVYVSEEQYQQFVEQMKQHAVVRNYEGVLRRKDGSPVYVLINAFAVRDPQERILQYRGLMLDISGLKSYEAELQRERDFSGKILNNTQNLILVTDTAGLISYANRRWAEMGYQQKQLLGLPLIDLIASPRRPNFTEAFNAAVSGQQPDNLELQILRGDGRIGQFSVNLSPMRDEQGSVASLVVFMTDVTESATLQAKLVHAEKMAAVGQLVSGVAHEVNNPLTAILGFADLLMENSDIPESARKDLRVILQEAQRTKLIVQNLLSFARQMPPQRKPVQLNSILRRTVQLRAYDFHSHGVQVSEQFDQTLPDVIGDSHQLQQVFLNILNNAYDAVRDIGRPARIDLITARQGSSVEVWFRDNGQGISNPDRIFDPFFTTKEVGKGTGLGLSICYGIVHEHGGEILCHNNADGEGASFIVRLPAASEAASQGAAAGVIQR